jgi:hypothetical protein
MSGFTLGPDPATQQQMVEAFHQNLSSIQGALVRAEDVTGPRSSAVYSMQLRLLKP